MLASHETCKRYSLSTDLQESNNLKVCLGTSEEAAIIRDRSTYQGKYLLVMIYI